MLVFAGGFREEERIAKCSSAEKNSGFVSGLPGDGALLLFATGAGTGPVFFAVSFGMI
jgi:hypothetical protein